MERSDNASQMKQATPTQVIQATLGGKNGKEEVSI